MAPITSDTTRKSRATHSGRYARQVNQMKFNFRTLRTAHSAVAIALNVFLAPSVFAATSSFVIKDIQIDGLKRIEPSSVFAYVPLKRGDVFSDDKASETIRALYATGFFDDVQVETQGNVVIVKVQERAAVSSIDFAGIHEFDKDNLTKALHSVGLSQGSTYDKALVGKAEQELKRQYLTRGYYAADVTTTVTPIDRNRVSILFSVTEGPSAKIRQINFIGNQVASTTTLLDEMQLSTPNWFSWYTKNDLYAKDKLSGDLEKVRSYYLNRGYLEFNIDSTQVSISPDKKDMYRFCRVKAGEVVFGPDKYALAGR